MPARRIQIPPVSRAQTSLPLLNFMEVKSVLLVPVVEWDGPICMSDASTGAVLWLDKSQPGFCVVVEI